MLCCILSHGYLLYGSLLAKDDRMSLALKMEGDEMGRGLCRDLANGPGSVVGEVRGKDTNSKLTLQ